MDYTMNGEISTQNSSIGMDGRLMHHRESLKHKTSEVYHSFLNHGIDDSKVLPNGQRRSEKKNVRNERRSKLDSLGSNNLSNEPGLFMELKGRTEKSDKEYAATQTTEAILAEIFGEKTQASKPEQKRSKERYCNGPEMDSKELRLNGRREPFLYSHRENFFTSRFKDSNFERRTENIPTIDSSKCEYQDTPLKQTDFVCSSFENTQSLDNLSTFENADWKRPGSRLNSTENKQTVKDLLDIKYERHLRRDCQPHNLDVNSNAIMRSFNGSAVKISRQMTSRNHSSGLHHEPLVQSNVVDYYDKLKRQEKEKSYGDPRGSLRSKSSEMALRKDHGHTTSSTYGLSKSWGSTRNREEFHSINKNKGKAKEPGIGLARKQKVEQMFRAEEKIGMKKAQEFVKLKLLRKVFAAWQMKAQVLKIKADELCKLHLLQKGFKGLLYAVEHQRIVVDSFLQKQNKIVLVKYWQMWQRQTHEKQRRKMQETFTQWHYFKLHVERTKLLESIANRHFLSKNYSKWKNRFNAKQKNSLASVHFKINLIYKYWNCWAVFVKERRVKNHLNSLASYHYGEKTQRHLFHYWKSFTQKSLLSHRLARRRVLVKAFFHWKHWTQYAKIVHLRLQNMCKEYHKKTLTKRMFRKWRQAQRMKLTLEFRRKTQLRRAIKLWNLRYMRKRIHKHLCKALARKAKKRRFFEQWICFVKQQQETRAEFLRKMKDFHTRTVFKCWRDETTRTVLMRKLMQTFQQDKANRIFHHHWQSWKYQLKLVEMRKRSQNNWSLRCVRKYCEVWKLKVKKVNLGAKFHQSRSVFEILLVRRYFNTWQLELQQERDDRERSHNVARILRKNSLCRILQAWRVVNQEECIIEPLVKRRRRKDLARIFDAWRRFFLRRTHFRRLQNERKNSLRRNVWETWSIKLWSITKGREIEDTMRHSKLARHFLAWLEYISDLRQSERMAEKRKEWMMRQFIETWKKNAQKKAALREEENSQKSRRQIVLRCFFNFWKRKATEHVQTMTSLVRTADSTRKRVLLKRSLLRWQRQYTVELKTSEFLKLKWDEKLRTVFLAWRDFTKAELERQVYDFATNLAMESSQGSAFLSTSGYQTSLKNSSSSLQFLAPDEIFYPVPIPRSRPVTPTLTHDDISTPKPFAILPSYRSVTMDRSFQGSQTSLVSERPPSRCESPLTRQRSLEQLSLAGTSPQRSSEDDGVPSSGIHSAGDESDQDERTSVHITESLFSYQTTSDYLVRDRELLVAETIIHWRSLSLSVAFRSWYKYTQHVILVRMAYAEWIVRDREKLVTKYLGKWRRWLFVSVLARQHWVNQVKKKFLFKWISYRKQQILTGQDKDEANEFLKRNLLKKFYSIWKRKRTAKSQLQNIVMRWQKTAKVTDMDKQVIKQYKELDRVNCMRRTFCYWKNATRLSQQATQMSKISSLQRYFLTWGDVACFRAELRKKMKTFRAKRVLAKAFKEWLLRYEAVRTAKIIIGVSEERKTGKIFKAWHAWASATSYKRKTSLLYCRSQQRRRLKAKFIFWFDAAKKCIDLRNYYQKSLQRRVLRSWHGVLIQKANASGTIEEFQGIVLRNTLRSTFMFWRKRTKDNQTMLNYSKLKSKRRLSSAFNRWKQEKTNRDAQKHFCQRLQKKTFTFWCEQISKRKKARQHFKFWQTKAEGSKELNQVADTLVHNAENKLLKMKFLVWRKLTQHSQVAKYHHDTKMVRRYFLGWYDHCRVEKRLSNQLKQFQQLHQRNNSGLLTKYMKIWLMKSTFTMKAENLHNLKLHSRYWRLWRHNFVRRRVSSAMVEHDNQKILSRVLISWFKITASHKSLSNEIETFILRRWFRKWMARYNNS